MFLANFLSELARVAYTVQLKRDFAVYSAVHPLKIRLNSLKSSAQNLHRAYRKEENITDRVKNHEQNVKQVLYFTELLHLLHFVRAEGVTGLTFVANALRLTDAGRLFYRHPLLEGGKYRTFSVALAFEGLVLSHGHTGGA